MATFFGFAMSDAMFEGEVTVRRTVTNPEDIRAAAEAGELIPCLNPSHMATIAAMEGKFGIHVPIPDTAPKVSLGAGDTLIVMGVRGLPRLGADRHEYTDEEVASATFSFARWDVLS